MSSYDLLATVSSQVSRFKPFHKFSKVSKKVFAFDITLVALSIRYTKLNVYVDFTESWMQDRLSSR